MSSVSIAALERHMVYYLVKLAVTVGIVMAVSEIAKRSMLWGGLLASLPLVSLLSFVWIYVETRDPAKVSALSRSVFWLVLPSLPLFMLLPLLLDRHVNFYASLALACVATMVLYAIMVAALARFGVEL